MAGKPGRSGRKDTLWADAIRIAVLEATEEGDRKKLRALADKTVTMGLDGDMAAIREIGDRLDGKPRQALEHTGKDGGPLQTHGVLVVPAAVSVEEWVEQARRLQKPPE